MTMARCEGVRKTSLNKMMCGWQKLEWERSSRSTSFVTFSGPRGRNLMATSSRVCLHMEAECLQRDVSRPDNNWVPRLEGQQADDHTAKPQHSQQMGPLGWGGQQQVGMTCCPVTSASL